MIRVRVDPCRPILRCSQAATSEHSRLSPGLTGWEARAAWFEETTRRRARALLNRTFDKYPELKVAMLESVSPGYPGSWGGSTSNTGASYQCPLNQAAAERAHSRQRTPGDTTEVTPKEFAQLVEMAGLEHVYVFASDYPHYDADSVDAVLPGTLPEELRRRVRFENALETYPKLRNLAA